MKDMIAEHLASLEKLLRVADDKIAHSTGLTKKQYIKQRNAINQACNALYKGTVA